MKETIIFFSNGGCWSGKLQILLNVVQRQQAKKMGKNTKLGGLIPLLIINAVNAQHLWVEP